MGILATDILIKTMLEAGLADLQKNQWILDDIFNGLAVDPISKAEYGWKAVKRAKEWFQSNAVNVYLPMRIDAPTMPCLSIVGPQSTEKESRSNLADYGQQEQYLPEEATRQPQMVYSPFTPASYDPVTGYVEFPAGILTEVMAPGMFLVSQKSGQAYVINQIIDGQTFAITEGTVDDFTDAWVSPPTQLWNLRREIAFLGQTFTIGVHTIGDPVTICWLRDLVIYMFGRYREAYLEARGFAISTISAGVPYEDTAFDKQRVWSCDITLSGDVQFDWIKWVAPKLNVVLGNIRIADGPATPPEYLAQAEAQGWQMEADPLPVPPTNPGNIPDHPEGYTPDTQQDFNNPNETEDEQ